jgi:hypothetical protein
MHVRNSIFAAFSILIGMIIALGLAEIALRFLPVSDGLRTVAVDDANPVFHFAPNRELTWSRDWNFDIVNRIRVNNAGYVNQQNYDVADPRPLLAIVGDSYVEAAMVPYAQTLHGRLSALAARDMRVYSFAASGAPLSQYLVWAREARVNWKARALVVVVVGNDFDESLATYKIGDGFHHYVETADGSLELRRFDHRPSGIRLALQRSALARYLLLNLQVQHLPYVGVLAHLVTGHRRNEEFVGNTSAEAGRERLDRSQAAVRAFLADIDRYAGWRADQVLFVVDGIRYASRTAMLAGSYFGEMRNYFMAQARRAGFEVIDMDAHFFARARHEPVRFEFPTDGHWNGLAHGVAADAVKASELFTRWRRQTGGS